MTAKVIRNFQTISLRPQNDLEKMIIENIRALIVSGKEPLISFSDEDMIIEVKSKKQGEVMKVEKDGVVKEIPDNIISDYKSAGWNIINENKKETKPKKKENKEIVDIDGEQIQF